MRISDWSSDVCSSDLDGVTEIPGAEDVIWNEAFAIGGPACTIQQFEQASGVRVDNYAVIDFGGFKDMVDAIDGDRTSVVEGQRDAVRVELGGRRCIKKKKHKI